MRLRAIVPLITLAFAGCAAGPVEYDTIIRGGTVYDLAAPLYGYGSRGEDFLRLQSELRRLFGLEATS